MLHFNTTHTLDIYFLISMLLVVCDPTCILYASLHIFQHISIILLLKPVTEHSNNKQCVCLCAACFANRHFLIYYLAILSMEKHSIQGCINLCSTPVIALFMLKFCLPLNVTNNVSFNSTICSTQLPFVLWTICIGELHSHARDRHKEIEASIMNYLPAR